MKTKGVCYDVGRVLQGHNWRPRFDPEVVHRELEIVHEDLHCNAVRLQGFDLDRLSLAAEDALAQGLDVWFSPEMWDRDTEETRAYVVKGAERAERLREQWPGKLVFSVGSEVTLFTQGFLPGHNVLERLAHPALRETLRAGKHNPPLNAFLSATTAGVREVFRGPVTYASVGLETVDWTPFDYVGVDLYRDQRVRERYPELIARYRGFGKPVANMEFGCCTFRGAEDLGGRGWDIVDWSKVPPQLKGNYTYDEATQAHEVAELLRINDGAGVDSTFVFTFEDQAGLEDENRELIRQLPFDFDITRYGLVKMHLEERPGTVYPDMPWEPKASFRAVAEYYATH
ncbi:MAG TPA: abortive infection protein [Thermoplasmata archaeon]|nr:abortive infection protein [Thermoplasmata archaeon]